MHRSRPCATGGLAISTYRRCTVYRGRNATGGRAPSEPAIAGVSGAWCSTRPSLLSEAETRETSSKEEMFSHQEKLQKERSVDLTRLMNLRTPPLVVRILVSTPTWLYFNLTWQHPHHRLHCHHRPHLHHAYLTNFLPPLVQNY
ncbi:hypothetical protein Bbelb_292850 [Branchiostoma belcheri]|nr:hypothetical protein Bbelb_292850 [Branchiostoma belcheri]